MEVLIETDEIKEILISVAAISLAFSIAFSGGLEGASEILRYPKEFLLLVVISGITIGSGFVLHEMGHKMAAIYYGAYSKFRMWTQGLVLMLLASLWGVLFAAPGAVYIYSRKITRQQNGIISVAGPMVNIVLMFFFFALSFIHPITVYFSFLGGISLGSMIYNGMINVWMFGAFINLLLGLFNMIPAFPLDGSKVLAWSKAIWVLLIMGMFAIGYVFNLIGIVYIMLWGFMLLLALVFSKLLFG